MVNIAPTAEHARQEIKHHTRRLKALKARTSVGGWEVSRRSQSTARAAGTSSSVTFPDTFQPFQACTIPLLEMGAANHRSSTSSDEGRIRMEGGVLE